MKNNESMEMYLETIYLISKKGKKVHSIDIAKDMGFSKPSVSRAMKLLEKNDYIVFHQDGEIELTKEGLKKASLVYEKHTILTSFLMSLGADSKLAEEDACRIEHIISDEMFQLIKNKVNEND